MPGWLSKVPEAKVPQDHMNGANDADVPQEQSRPSAARSSLSQVQKDQLIAEMLGDVAALADSVKTLSQQINALGQAVTANDFVRWRNTLDLKMSELADINLSQQAAARLQSFATTYLEHLSAETNMLVRVQVKRAVADTMTFNTLFDKLNRDWLLRLSSIGGVCFVGTALANIIFK